MVSLSIFLFLIILPKFTINDAESFLIISSSLTWMFRMLNPPIFVLRMPIGVYLIKKVRSTLQSYFYLVRTG